MLQGHLRRMLASCTTYTTDTGNDNDTNISRGLSEWLTHLADVALSITSDILQHGIEDRVINKNGSMIHITSTMAIITGCSAMS